MSFKVLREALQAIYEKVKNRDRWDSELSAKTNYRLLQERYEQIEKMLEVAVAKVGGLEQKLKQIYEDEIENKNIDHSIGTYTVTYANKRTPTVYINLKEILEGSQK